jgi:hypothetical protein
MKLLIIGNARHGKDTLAEIFRDEFGIQFESSSHAACRLAIYPALRDKYGYDSLEECFLDRVNHRKEWYDMICEYNSEDGSRLTKDILGLNPSIPGPGSDIYVGLRAKREFDASRHLFDLVIFVDASGRLPPEDKSSCTISKDDADVLIYNNGSYEDFLRKGSRFGEGLFGKK